MRLGIRKTTDRISILADLSDRSTDFRRIRNRKNCFYPTLLEKHLCTHTLCAKVWVNIQGDIARLEIPLDFVLGTRFTLESKAKKGAFP